jgi:hypothetical protein
MYTRITFRNSGAIRRQSDDAREHPEIPGFQAFFALLAARIAVDEMPERGPWRKAHAGGFASGSLSSACSGIRNRARAMAAGAERVE